MKTRVICIGARKGGVGKTALARELGARLARDGRRVVLVNADSQDTLTMVLGMPPEPGLSRVLLTEAPAVDWLREVPRKAWAADGATGALFVLPGDETTAEAGVQLILRKAPLMTLRDKLAELVTGDVADVIVMDTSPSIMPFSPWMYAAADAAIIPTGGALEGVNGIRQTERGFQVITQVTKGRQDVRVIGIVPTQFLARANLHKKNWSTLKRTWGDKVWPVLMYRVTWQYATQFGQALTVYAPGSEADREAEQAYGVLRALLAAEESEVAHA